MAKKPSTAEPVDFTPPEHLSDRSKALWLAVVPSRAMSAGRLAMIQVALEALDRADEARLAVRRDGLTTKTATTGDVHVNPLVKIERECRAQFAKIWESLGLAWETRTDGMTGTALERMLAKQANERDDEDEDENGDE